MTENKGHQSGHEGTPADQPHPPGGGDTCIDWPKSDPPKLDPPTPCPKTDCECKHPPPSSTGPKCLEDEIAKDTAQIAAAEKAKVSKADAEAMLAKAKAAAKDYTREKYNSLVKQWVDEDVAIAELIRKLVCAVPCWRCVIECYVCPLINELHQAEQWLRGDGKLYTDVHSLYDLRYWYARDKEIKEARLQRIKDVLAAWEKPAATIEANLNKNKAAIEAAAKLLVSDPGKAIYDVFLKIVPLHLSIAPPQGSAWQTNIEKKYTVFCECDGGTQDYCCGPDVGEPSLRQRLIGPQPYLIDPNHFNDVICCLVVKRYRPAKDALNDAEAAWAKVDNDIQRYTKQIKDGLAAAALESQAKAAIPSTIKCGDCEPDEVEPRTSQLR